MNADMNASAEAGTSAYCHFVSEAEVTFTQN